MDFNIIQPAPTGESQWAKDMRLSGAAIQRMEYLHKHGHPIDWSFVREWCKAAFIVCIFTPLAFMGLLVLLLRLNGYVLVQY